MFCSENDSILIFTDIVYFMDPGIFWDWMFVSFGRCTRIFLNAIVNNVYSMHYIIYNVLD